MQKPCFFGCFYLSTFYFRSMIWIVALVLLALLGWIGFQGGAVRAAVSFVGLLIAAAVAVPAAPLIERVLGMIGVKHPLIQQGLVPGIVFLLLWIVFQIIAQTVHHKIELFYKYKTDDKSRYKFERMNDRVGLCVGLLNGVAFFMLAMIPVYVFGYLTVQVASGDSDSGSIRYINSARQELRSTGFDKVVAGYDPASTNLYDAFDVAGVVFKNPVSVARLARYPAFLTLSERPEFQQLANDTDFHNLWQSGASIGDILKYPKIQAISTNAALVKEIETILVPDLQDLKAFLVTGESAKYSDQSILGRWQFDFAGTINQERKNRPNLSALELRQLRARIAPFWGATFIATIDNKVILKRSERVATAQNAPRTMAEGSWERKAGTYHMTVDNNVIEAVIEDRNKLILPWGDLKFLFVRELQ